nr:hypothetical protein [Nostoc sp. LEGE 06077]
MGIANEETATRSTQERLDVNTDTRRGRDVRREGQSDGHQQERDDRTNSKRASILSPGISITGGMLRQLIGDYRDQLASKKEEIKKLYEEIHQLDAEAEKIESRIQEFESLQSQLENDSEHLE